MAGVGVGIAKTAGLIVMVNLLAGCGSPTKAPPTATPELAHATAAPKLVVTPDAAVQFQTIMESWARSAVSDIHQAEDYCDPTAAVPGNCATDLAQVISDADEAHNILANTVVVPAAYVSVPPLVQAAAAALTKAGSVDAGHTSTAIDLLRAAEVAVDTVRAPLGIALPTPEPTPTPTATPAPPPPPVVAFDRKGSGAASTSTFSVSSEWTLAWSYNCGSFGSRGNFIVSIYSSDGSTNPGDGPNQIGESGSSTESYHQGGEYYLEINSECAWHVTVTSYP
jgi:hypothetical protein